MRALSQDELNQVSGGWGRWGWSSRNHKSSYCQPKTTYACAPKTHNCNPKPACEPAPVCEPKPVCPPPVIILPTE